MASLLHKKFFSRPRRFVWSGSKPTELGLGSRIWATLVSPTQLYSVWLTRHLSPITCCLTNTPRHVSVPCRFMPRVVVHWPTFIFFFPPKWKWGIKARILRLLRSWFIPLKAMEEDFRFVFRLHKKHFAPNLICEFRTPPAGFLPLAAYISYILAAFLVS